MLHRPFFPALPKALAVCLIGLCAAGAAPEAPQGAETLEPVTACDTPHVHDMVGQMIMVGFPGHGEKDEGVAAARELLAKGTIGGVVLFPENIAAAEQLKNLTAYLRNARSDPAPFIAVDQEGGKVQRLGPENGHKRFPSPESVARNPSFATEGAAKRLYGEMAAELADAGFNMNLGPVVDLNRNPRNPVIGARGRSFSADPNTVTALATAFIEAHRAANIATVAKHFPGHGSSTVDSHKALADVSKTWAEVELEPYRRLAKAGLLDGVMIGHLYHPRFSDRKGLPASLSAKAVQALRNAHWLDFQGVIVSDDMEMGAVRDDFSQDERAVKAIGAGTDIVVFSNVKSNDPRLGAQIHDAVVKAVCEGRLPLARIEQSYARIMKLKQRLEQKDLAGTW